MRELNNNDRQTIIPLRRHRHLQIKMEHEKCYVFKPNDERPSKRRRVSAATNNASLELRKKTCRELWDAQQERIDVRLPAFDTTHPLIPFRVSLSMCTALP